MTAEQKEEQEEVPRKRTPEIKRKEHMVKIKRTLIGCILGILTGVISFIVVDRSQILGFNSYTMLGLLIMVAGIVVQRHIFLLLHLGSVKMGAKDWFYQGFMTFAFWFITWTILLTGGSA
ncbi:MAG: hypothetical protein LUQ01_05095 [Methanolinea sp.]|nr:hypothetical protein [Methanolinea sp.]